jgi:adenylate cyclase
MNAGSVGVLAKKKLNFADVLTPLRKDNFRKELFEVEKQLRITYKTLSMLSLAHEDFEAFLSDMLNAITWKIGDLIGADRATIFLLDEEQNQLWSLIAKDEGKGSIEIRMPADQGIAGEVAQSKQIINISYDFYDDPRSSAAKEFDRKNAYRTYTMLTLPLLNEQGDLVAVVQLLNKLKTSYFPGVSLAEKIDFNGFSDEDEQLFADFSSLIRLILQSSQSFYIATQKQRAAEALLEATRSLASSSLNLEETLNRVMNEAKKLMNADRSTLWLLEGDELWAKILQSDGNYKEIRAKVGQGYVGKVAASGKPLNIPFDLYKDPESIFSQELDQSNGYRTCSLLCLPIFNGDRELIGVTQLVNKRKSGEFSEYNPSNWPDAPECWKASFNRSDLEFMEAFNIQAGVALQNAKLFDQVKQQYAQIQQQEQVQRDILRSLTNGVISTNEKGEIIAANPSAKKMLGKSENELLEGAYIQELIQLKEGNFTQWFRDSLVGKDTKFRQQYYPDQTLVGEGSETRSFHLSINSISDALDSSKVRGVLVVMDDISDEKRLKNTMYRYMTQELAEKLLQSGNAKLGGDRKEVSILFSDIRGYTNLVEKMEPEDVVSMLNEYFAPMGDAIFRHQGMVDKYMGDAIMAVFGSPIPLEDHGWKSVQTALEMRFALIEFNAHRLALNARPIRIGMGIHSGEAISGNVGHSRRMEFTVIGDDVNLASRLEGTTKMYGCDIVLSESTYQHCHDRVWVRELDIVRVKGKKQPVKIYELVGLRSDIIADSKLNCIELYEIGRQYYLNRDFQHAIAKFEEVLAIHPEDLATKLQLSRCQHWLGKPLSDDWDGIETLTEK